MVVAPKFVRAVWTRTTSEDCVSCSGQLEISVKNSGSTGPVRIFVEGTGLMVPSKVYDEPHNLAQGSTDNWVFKIPYWANQKPSVTVKTGPASSEAWTEQKTLTPTA